LAFVHILDLLTGELGLIDLGPGVSPKSAFRVIAERSRPGIAWTTDSKEVVFLARGALRRLTVAGS
jgi:hypothetical protein